MNYEEVLLGRNALCQLDFNHDQFLHFKSKNATKILECGPMPNLMVALPNIGGALCSTPQSLADAHY